MTKEQLYAESMQAIFEKPRYWTNGQAIYNFIQAKYHVADMIRDDYGVDCFHEDDEISNFLSLACEIINKKQDERAN